MKNWPFLNFDVNQVCSKVWKLRRGEFNSRFFEGETNNLILKRPSDAYLILIHEKLGKNQQEVGPVKGLSKNFGCGSIFSTFSAHSII